MAAASGGGGGGQRQGRRPRRIWRRLPVDSEGGRVDLAALPADSVRAPGGGSAERRASGHRWPPVPAEQASGTNSSELQRRRSEQQATSCPSPPQEGSDVDVLLRPGLLADAEVIGRDISAKHSTISPTKLSSRKARRAVVYRLGVRPACGARRVRAWTTFRVPDSRRCHGLARRRQWSRSIAPRTPDPLLRFPEVQDIRREGRSFPSGGRSR